MAEAVATFLCFAVTPKDLLFLFMRKGRVSEREERHRSFHVLVHSSDGHESEGCAMAQELHEWQGPRRSGHRLLPSQPLAGAAGTDLGSAWDAGVTGVCHTTVLALRCVS